MIDTILIFAAGEGSRMKHLTQKTPKPLLKIKQKPILEYILELVNKHRFKRILINTYNHKDLIIDFIKKQTLSKVEIDILEEPYLLGTGGCIKYFNKIIGNKPIFTINSDSIFKTNLDIFEKLQYNWQPDIMDFLLLSIDIKNSYNLVKNGDFNISKNGYIYDVYNKLNDDNLNISRKYLFSGLQIIKPQLISHNKDDIFSLGRYYVDKKYIQRIHSNIYDDKWYHATKPEDINIIETLL